jgi:hypothetical protein
MIAKQPALPRHAAPSDDDELRHPIPDAVAGLWACGAQRPRLDALTLCFSVSRDEEYVALTARDEHWTIDLGARAHHLVLLALARSRLADRASGSPTPGAPRSPRSDGAEGWVYFDELVGQLAMDEAHVNVAVYRIRRQLSDAGVVDAASVIERRRMTREIRVGVARIEIATV